MKNNVLTLTIKKKWFDMIKSGYKKEEYREIKEYWIKRLHFDIYNTKPFDLVRFRNGYKPDSPTVIVELKSVRVGKPKTIWVDEWQDKDVYILELGNIVGGNSDIAPFN